MSYDKTSALQLDITTSTYEQKVLARRYIAARFATAERTEVLELLKMLDILELPEAAA